MENNILDTTSHTNSNLKAVQRKFRIISNLLVFIATTYLLFIPAILILQFQLRIQVLNLTSIGSLLIGIITSIFFIKLIRPLNRFNSDPNDKSMNQISFNLAYVYLVKFIIILAIVFVTVFKWFMH